MIPRSHLVELAYHWLTSYILGRTSTVQKAQTVQTTKLFEPWKLRKKARHGPKWYGVAGKTGPASTQHKHLDKSSLAVRLSKWSLLKVLDAQTNYAALDVDYYEATGGL
jgi:hypothetical protein